MLMYRIALQQPSSLVFISVALMLLSISCSASPVAPIVTFGGDSTDNAKLEVVWPKRSVRISGGEIASAFELPDGVLIMRKNVLSARSGLPTLLWWGDELGPKSMEISVDRAGANLIVQVLDKESGKTLVRRVQADDSMGATASVPQIQSSVVNNILKLPNGQLDLANVLHGGKWRVEPSLAFNGYDGVVEWECVIAPYNIDGPMPPDICYCQFSPESDDPTCWGYRRLAYAAFKKKSLQEVEVVIFDANFSAPDTDDLLPKGVYSVGKIRNYGLNRR